PAASTAVLLPIITLRTPGPAAEIKRTRDAFNPHSAPQTHATHTLHFAAAKCPDAYRRAPAGTHPWRTPAKCAPPIQGHTSHQPASTAADYSHPAHPRPEFLRPLATATIAYRSGVGANICAPLSCCHFPACRNGMGA